MINPILESVLAKLALDQIDAEIILELDPMYNTEMAEILAEKDDHDDIVVALGKGKMHQRTRAIRREQKQKHHEPCLCGNGNVLYSDQHRRKFTHNAAQYLAGRISYDSKSAKERKWEEQYPVTLEAESTIAYAVEDLERKEMEVCTEMETIDDEIRKLYAKIHELDDRKSLLHDERVEIMENIYMLKHC